MNSNNHHDDCACWHCEHGVLIQQPTPTRETKNMKSTIARLLIAVGLVLGGLAVANTATAVQPPTVNHPEGECSGTFIKDQPPFTGTTVTAAYTGDMWLKIGNQHVYVPTVTKGETYGPGDLSSWPRSQGGEPQDISHVDYCVDPYTEEEPDNAFVRVTSMCLGQGEYEGIYVPSGQYLIRVRHESGASPVSYTLKVGSTELSGPHSISSGEVQYRLLVAGWNGVKAVPAGDWVNDYKGTASTSQKPCDTPPETTVPETTVPPTTPPTTVPHCPEGEFPQSYAPDAPCGPVDPCVGVDPVTGEGTTLWLVLPCKVPVETTTTSEVVTTTTTTSSTGGNLPDTGGNTGNIVAAAIAALLLGGGLAFASRRS